MRLPPTAPLTLWHASRQFLFGMAGLTVITFVALRLKLQPGATSLLYLIIVVFMSLRAGFVPSLAFSLIAVVSLNYFFIQRVSSPGTRNPLDIVAMIAFLITAWV